MKRIVTWLWRKLAWLIEVYDEAPMPEHHFKERP